MAATALTAFATNRVGGKPDATAANKSPAASFQACDATEGNSFANTGRQVLVLQTGAASRTVQFFDANGAVVQTVTLAESKTFAFGPFDVYNYGSTLTFKASNAAVLALVIKLNELKTAQVS